MSEITKIEIKNFQSHEHTEIVPAPSGELTVLIGSSDAGKTAVLRALRHVFYNLPQGIDFIRVGANSAHVRIDYASGHSVIRSRSHKGFNRYEILSPGNPPEKFEGFGATVPLEVQQITGVRPITIGDMTINLNLAGQLDGPFMGSAISALARAKLLGKLAGTEEVDYAAKACGTDLYRRKQDKERHQNDVTKLTTAIEGYAYLEELGDRITKAEALLAGIKERTNRVEKLKGLRGQMIQTDEAWRNTVQRILSVGNVIAYSEPFLTSAAQSLDRYQRLQGLSLKWNTTIAQLAIEEATLERTAHAYEAGTLLYRIAEDAARFTQLVATRHEYATIGGRIANEQCTLLRTQSIGEAEILLSCATKKAARHTYLHGRREALALVDNYLQITRRTLNTTKDVDTAIIRAEQLHDHITRLRKLQGASERYEDTTRSIMLQDMRISRLAGVDEAGKILDGVREKIVYRATLTNKAALYRSNKVFLDAHIVAIQQWTEEEESAKEAYRNILLAAGVCPVCGSVITESQLKEAV